MTPFVSTLGTNGASTTDAQAKPLSSNAHNPVLDAQDVFVKTYTRTREKQESITMKAKGRFVSEEHMREVMKLKETHGQIKVYSKKRQAMLFVILVKGITHTIIWCVPTEEEDQVSEGLLRGPRWPHQAPGLLVGMCTPTALDKCS